MSCGDDVLDIEFDFLQHQLRMRLGSGKNESLALRPKSVADFYREYRQCLDALGVSVKIWPMPVEVQNPIRFDLDATHKSYDPEYAQRFWQVLVRSEKVFRAWAPSFMGKVSPVHFFWGSFDLCVTRFSGRVAPPREGADSIQQEAYSREVISAGFWPGNGGFDAAAFYCYAAPGAAPACRRRRFCPLPRTGIKTWANTSSSTTMSCGRPRRGGGPRIHRECLLRRRGLCKVGSRFTRSAPMPAADSRTVNVSRAAPETHAPHAVAVRKICGRKPLLSPCN